MSETDWSREIEYFGWHPIVFTDKVYISANQIAGDVLDAVEDYLLKYLPQAASDQIKQVQVFANFSRHHEITFLRGFSD
jgi:hypothetical protein